MHISPPMFKEPSSLHSPVKRYMNDFKYDPCFEKWYH